MSAPRFTHYVVLLRIFHYLKGTMFHGLYFSTSSLELRAYSDADWVVTPLINDPPLATASSLWIHWYHGVIRNNLLSPNLATIQNIVLLLKLPNNLYGFDGFLRKLVLLKVIILFSVVTIKVPFRWLIIMSSMNVLNTSKSIVILYANMSLAILFVFYLSLLKINLPTSSPKFIYRAVFKISLPNSRCLSFTTLSLRGMF